MSTTQNLVAFDNRFTFNTAGTPFSLKDPLKDSIGYDPTWENNYGVGIPLTIPKDKKFKSIKFNLTLEAYPTWAGGTLHDDDYNGKKWKVWISETKYETTSQNDTKYDKVASNTPITTFDVDPYYDKSKNTRTISFEITETEEFQWTPEKTYYIYIWNGTTTCYCLWVIKGFSISNYIYSEYNVTYSSNGASGTTPGSQIKQHDVPLTLQGKGNLSKAENNIATYIVKYDSNGGNSCSSATVYKKEVFDLTGWNTKSDGTGKTYAFGGQYTNNEDVNLYLKITRTEKYPQIKLPSTTRTGYDSLEWVYSNKIYKPGESYEVKSNVTFKASWVPKKYKITYNLNYDNCPPSTVEYISYDSTVKVRNNDRTGHILSSWNTKADGKGTTTYKPSQSFCYNYDHDITLYAQWEPIQYTINYHLTNKIDTSNVNYYDIFTVKNLTSEKDGQYIKYWKTDSPNSKTLTVGEEITIAKILDKGIELSNNILDLYPVYEKSPFKISYYVYENQVEAINITDDELEDALNRIPTDFYINLYHKFNKWLCSHNNTKVDATPDFIRKYVDVWSNPRNIRLDAEFISRYNIVYKDDNRYKKLKPIYYNGENWIPLEICIF